MIFKVFPNIDRPVENSTTTKSVSAAGGRLYLATICGFGKFKGLVEEKVKKNIFIFFGGGGAIQKKPHN